MQSRNRRLSSWRAWAAAALTLLLVLPEAPAWAQRRGGGGGSRSRGSVNSVNRSSPGTGGSWSNARTSGTTSRTATGSGSSRSTTAQTRSGETVSGNRNVSKSGDEVTVDRNVQSTSGANKSSQKTYEMDDGRAESVERDVSATTRSGEIRTKVGDPLDLEAVGRDVARLDNLSIFAEIRVDGEPVGDDAVRLVFTFKEMPSWFPIISYVYTEENGLSWGAGLSAGNLTGRDLSVSARVYFGDLDQQWSRISWPWIRGNHVSFDFYGARYTRPDALRGFEETSYEFTPEVGTWVGDHGSARAKFSYFEMQSDTAGITLSPDGQDQLLRFGVSLGWDTRDSWRNPRRGWQNEIELWRTGGFLGGDGDFWAMNLDLRRWVPAARRTKLMVSGLLSLQSGTLGEDVPVYLNYFMGGANTIRGYDFTDLGEELSGQNQLLGTAEYALTVIPLRRWDLWKISLRLGAELAVFADAGIAWSESRDFTTRRARGGLGGGLRLLVPGSEMVRLDVGWSPDFGFHFHFANGTKPKAQRARLR